MDKKAEQLRSAAFSLHEIHLGTSKLQHAIRENSEEKWEVYFPTHFIYAFFAFNSMYNIDWKKSYENGRLVPVGKRAIETRQGKKYVEETESNKHSKYLSFCFNDSKFVRLYKDFFIRCVLKGDKAEDVKDMLTEIRHDWLPNGSVRTDEYIKRFQNAVDDLLCRGIFDKGTVEIILKFIYSVRCNIFHGVKSIDEMKDLGQQDRLDIYACFIVALNQMAFSYLDYLVQKDSFIGSFDQLFRDLMWTPKVTNSGVNCNLA